MDNNQLILRNQKFREEIVDLINAYNDIPAFMRKATVKEIYELLERVEEQEIQKAQESQKELQAEENNEEAEENTKNK